MAARFGISRLTGLMAKSSRRREAAAKKAAELYQAAKGSVGLKQTGIAGKNVSGGSEAFGETTEGYREADEKAVRRSSIRKEHTVNPWGRSSIVRSVFGRAEGPF